MHSVLSVCLLGVLCSLLEMGSVQSFQGVVSNRRQILEQAVAGASSSLLLLGGVGVVTSLPSAAFAAATAPVGPTPAELDRIRVGYRQINYLLDHFEQETTVCRDNGGECKRDADAIRRALGLRTINDPLFQIDKVFAKVKDMDLDPDKLDAFFDAAENWNSAMNMSNSMAFISQFGEYNPGGGKDEVLKYLNESQKQVVLARDALKTIMDCLDIQA